MPGAPNQTRGEVVIERDEHSYKTKTKRWFFFFFFYPLDAAIGPKDERSQTQTHY